MKILSIISSAIVLAIAHQGLSAQAQQQPQPQQQPAVVLTSLVDDVAVPIDILTAVQVEFQGRAVTKARVILDNGQPVYELRVDDDDIPDDYDSILLLFDTNWKFIIEKELEAPKPVSDEPPPFTVKKEKQLEKQGAREEKESTERTKPPIGGRGGESQNSDTQAQNESTDSVTPPSDSDRPRTGTEKPENTSSE